MATTPQLPVLTESRNSLVSIQNTPRVDTPRERASRWASEVRKRIEDNIKEGIENVDEEDVKKLKTELIAIFITALQQDSRSTWLYLQEILELLEPYQNLFHYYLTKAEFNHYLERIHSHFEIHRERLFDLPIVDCLAKVFPEEMQALRIKGPHPVKNYCNPPMIKQTPVSPRKSQTPRNCLPDGTNPYSTHIASDEEMLSRQSLTIRDLGKSIGNVAFEMAARESIWKHSLGTTALALNTDIPIPEEPGDKKLSRRTSSIQVRLTPEKLKAVIAKSIKTSQEEIPVMTGREAVIYFAKCHHIGKIESIYFNLAPSRYYRPYELISCPQNKAESEHYVFCTFGVLHVYPNQDSESMTLGEWQKEAVLWTAVSTIPFFKNYLVLKSFKRWRSNKLFLNFLRKKEILSKCLLKAVPAFGAALLQVSRLLKELLLVNFLPFELDKTYSLGEYENAVNYKNIQADKILERFFKFCKTVAEFTAEESFKKLRYCEDQVQKKSLFTKDSMHLQRVKKELREDNLKNARRETGQLGDFVRLMDMMIIEHMFDITKNHVLKFVHHVLSLTESNSSRDGFFKTNLVFNKHDCLTISPSKERFQRVLSRTLKGIPVVLCAKAQSMDGSGQQDQDVPDDGKSADISQSESKLLFSMLHIESKKTSVTSFGGSVKPDTSRTSTSEKASQKGETARPVSNKTSSSYVGPDLPKQVTPNKLDDELGVATPDLVLKDGEEILIVEGEGFMGQYEPIIRASLQEKLQLDGEYLEAIKVQTDLLKAAYDEIDHYCQSNEWLNEISHFCRKWNDKSVKEFKGAAAFTIEQKLTELRMWSEKIRNFDVGFTTENGLFLIDCSAIHDGLLPRLNDIYQELITFIAEEARSMSKVFCEEMKIVLKNMKDKRPIVSAFAIFAKNYSQYKKNTPQYQQRVEYIKSLFEVIRMSYRQLTPEEEKYEENVWASWEAFLMQMQDASEFVNTQTPLMTQLLEDNYQRLEKEAYELCEKATTGIFLDPHQNPCFILMEMKAIREKFFSVQIQLQDASKWREAICGEPYDLKFLNEMTAKMDIRGELWKYVEVSTNSIKDWKQTLFKKINIKKALAKVTEWIGAASQLKDHLDDGDLVLTHWYKTLTEFKKSLPLLYKLSNVALKERHWKVIFLGMNEPYDPSHSLTVDDLIVCNLTEHAELINSVYLSSLAEYDLELKLNKITANWEEKAFKLAKHIPDSLYAKDASNKRVQSSTKRQSKIEKFRQEKANASSSSLISLDVANDDLYIIIEVEKLKYQLEDTRITVESMAQSSYLGDVKNTVEIWQDNLQQIEEITDLWYTAQKKWMYLLKIFEKPHLYMKWPEQAEKFEKVHNKLKDWMRVVVQDNKVMSVVNHKRGSKGYRLLQGDYLRTLFLNIIAEEEDILKDFEMIFEETRQQFTRLFFLSNQDMVELLGISRNPQNLLPFVRKCFPGIQELKFDLPQGTSAMNTVLDFALNTEKLCVVSLCGMLGEEVPLLARLEANPSATKWLKTLESIMKNTLTVMMQACVQARMDEGSRQPIHILEELSQYKKPEAEALKIGIKQTYRHWLLQFPVQCVITAEAIMWNKSMSRILESPETEDLKSLRSNMESKLEQYIDILKEATTNGNIVADMRERLQALLYCLINQTISYRDVTNNLIENSSVSTSSFDWIKLMHHKMDIRNVLRAKTTEADGSQSQRLVHKASLRSVEEIPKLARARTTVSSDFQFSPCYIQNLGNVFLYDYEYLGPSNCLTLTPLTERAFLSLCQSLKNFQCGTLIGPAGTGKSQTIQELAKMLGRCLFTVTCNENLTLPMMIQFLSGLVQSGCWVLFDDTDKLTSGLMSVTAQHLDYLRTALKTLDMSNNNQYKIRGQAHFDKKVGSEEQVIRRNSLTTLHPLPHTTPSPGLDRQRTVPHGFNEKGLMTYFEDTWIAEREQRRHSIEREIEIKESELYRANRPPPLFYEHVKKRKSQVDYSKLTQEPSYFHPKLGNIMFNGRLIPASSNYGCFMTMTTRNNTASHIPENFRLLMRPCALVVPDTNQIIQTMFYIYNYTTSLQLAQKFSRFLSSLKLYLPNSPSSNINLREIKTIIIASVKNLRSNRHLDYISTETEDGESRTSETEDIGMAEENSLVFTLKELLTSRFEDAEHVSIFSNILKDVFPVAMSNQQDLPYQSYDPNVVSAIKSQLKDDYLEENEDLVLKTLQLHTAVEQKSPVIITGPTGSGKSTLYNTLSRAINSLNYKSYSPDHSKDELNTEYGLVHANTQKIKDDDGDIVADIENTDFIKTKKRELTGFKKIKNLRQNITRAQDYIDNVQDKIKEKKKPDHAEYPKVDVVKINPTSMMPEELLGHFQNGLWSGGLLTKIVKDSYTMALATKAHVESYVNGDKKLKNTGTTELPSILTRWIVLDGEMDPLWTDGFKTLLDEQRCQITANAEKIERKDTTSVIFETCSLHNASPSSIARCSVVHCQESTVYWKSLFYHWKQTAKHRWVITANCTNILENLIDDVFPPTLKYLKSECMSGLNMNISQTLTNQNSVVKGIQEVTSFFMIFNAMLDRVLLRDELERKLKLETTEDRESSNKSMGSSPSRNMSSRLTTTSQIDMMIPNYMELVQSMFAFSFIWAFGGSVHDRFRDRFSRFAHEILYHARHPIRLPMWGQVFDYYVEESSGAFVRWSEKQTEKLKNVGGFIVTSETERYHYIIDLLVHSNQPVLLSGSPGVGKTSLIQNLIMTRHASTTIRMSHDMTSSLLQTKLLSRVMELKNRGLNPVGASALSHGKQSHLFFIDDLSMCGTTGSYQPSLELLRQTLTHGAVYDKQRLELQTMPDIGFVAACTNPASPGTGLGTSSHLLSSRLTRLFVNLNLFKPSTDTLLTVFSKPLHSWLEEFPSYSVEHHQEFAKAMVVGLLEVYNSVRERLKPSPAHAHYLFNLHDLAKVVQGVLLMSPRSRLRKNKNMKKADKRSKGRKTSVDGYSKPAESSEAAPMMKVIAQLWCHECLRIFSDRLISDEDQSWFIKMLEDTAIKQFCSPRDELKLEMSAISEEPVGRSTPAQKPRFTPPVISMSTDFDDTEEESEEEIVKEPSETDENHVDSESQSEPKTDVSITQETIEEADAEQETSSETTGPGQISEEDAETVENEPKKPSVSDESQESEDSDDDADDDDSDSTDETMTYGSSSLGEVGKENTPGYKSSQMTNQASLSSSNPTSNTTSTPQTLDSKPSSYLLEVTSGTSLPGKGGKQSKNARVKRGVTFKAGLIADRDYEAYAGPLMSVDEFKSGNKALTSIIFSKYYRTCYTEHAGLPIEKGYIETNENNLLEAMTTCLDVYNNGTSQQLDLVFFQEALHHAARLSRVLAYPGGHALLLGISYCTGRATLARLASYTANCKIFEPKALEDKNKNLMSIKEHIKRSCFHAGVNGRSTVLLIHEGLGPDCLQLVTSVMAEGKAPELYSNEEVTNIVCQMMPGGVQTKRVDKIEQAFDRYVKRIKQNLHIIVCLNYKGNSYSSDFKSLQDKINQYPELIKYCFSIDLYKPWSFQAYASIAKGWLEDPNSKITIPWSISKQTQQVDMASKAMAYIHMSSKTAIERQYCHEKEPLRFYTPLTFMEFVHIFKVVAAFTVRVEKIKAKKYEAALCKIDEAFGSIATYKKEVSCLAPKHKSSMDTIQDLVEKVESQKQQYIQALEKCKTQEDKIAEIQSPLEQLRRTTQLEFDKVNPSYEAAQEVLKSINKADIDEVKTFNDPPEGVKFVIKAICLLFNRPEEWSEGKLLLLKENFIQEMIFYNKDNIPPHIYKALQKYIFDPIFNPDILKKHSSAIASLCLWVHAIYKYIEIHRQMRPHLKNLSLAQTEFNKAQGKLGQLRITANKLKSSLEREITAHKEAMKEAKAIEKKIQGVERKIARASNLMGNMSMQHFLWRSELKKARRHIRAAPGDALITAACVCYHGPLEDKFRSELLADWLDRCRQGLFDTQSLVDHSFYSTMSKVNLLKVPENGKKSPEKSSPQVKTFRYISAVYDSRKYYKSELKRQDTMESVIPNIEIDEEDDKSDLSPLSVRPGYTLQSILSDFDELSDWRMNNLPTDLHSVQNALLMRVSCFNRKHCWPLLIDPDNQAEMWVKAVQKSSNIFTERDVLDDPNEYVAGMPLPSNPDSIESGDTVYQEHPPSRGTMLTFSDVTEFSIPDNYTVITETSRGMGSRQSTTNSDELRPVTSVTNSWKNYNLRADSSIDHPEHNLWIIEADDPQINSRLINAIVHGVTVLVTHLERKPLDPLFRGLLLKQFYVDKDGNRVVHVAGVEFRYHPDFCLYLSTTLPVFLKGDGLHHFPLHRLCVINMSISDEAIINRLLFETMKVERKEFEGQKRSNENDIILHRQMLAKEHEIIREKTLHLDVPLLDDRTMLESLITCQNNVEKNKIILEETRYMGNHLEGKFTYYVPMLMKATMLFNILKELSVLSPCYYMSFHKFVEIFSQVVASRDRGKGAVGATPARAQELSDATTSAILKYSAMMMFEEHYNQLCLLLALEHMVMIQKASTKEMSLFVNGFEKCGVDESGLLQHKPEWIENKVWVDLNVLESLHPVLQGLCDSIREFSTEWKEYFQLPIVLMNPVPGINLQELTAFQKCLIWKMAQPQRLSELSQVIVNYELGSVVSPADHYNINTVYSYTNQFTPTLLLLPSSRPHNLATTGHPYINPIHEVKRLAKTIGMEGKVRIINFGVESELNEVLNALNDCIQNGYWLVLQNYHLAENIDEEFLVILKELVYSRFLQSPECQKKSINSEEGRSLITQSQPSSHSKNSKIHPMFRLWITSRIDGRRVIPGILVQHGLRVTCETTINFKSTLQKSFRSAAFLLNSSRAISAAQTDERFRKIMSLALYHALLQHQSYYGNEAFANRHHWELTDLASASSLFKYLFVSGSDPIKSAELISHIYSNHCLDEQDAKIVESIGQELLKVSLQEVENVELDENTNSVANLLKKLITSESSEKSNLNKALDSIEDTSARTFCLPLSAEKSLVARKSRIMNSDMIQVIGAPELFLISRNSQTTNQSAILISQLLEMLQDLPKLPLTSKDEIYPLDIYFHYEVEGYKKLIEKITSDLTLISKEVKGDITLTSDLAEVKKSLLTDEVPLLWKLRSKSLTIKQTLQELKEKLQTLKRYLDKFPACVNLCVFFHPERLFDVLLQQYARKQFKDVSDLKLEFQVMPVDFSPSISPKSGVFVTGLTLHNATWDASRSFLIPDTETGSQECQDLPPVWIKPVIKEESLDVKNEIFKCSVFSSVEHSNQCSENAVCTIDLPTLFPDLFWKHKRIFISTNFTYNSISK
ncbi:hypothetical protein LOTGIDRAFT_173233 [Lottia gigantea]|uniref:AAA+ ATPase domain-containing protein n=1 Tax=Lottia gigantea TaxID=225164 RepID=V4CEK6_LOTGI|nr:hypothetical protein LOTGIDRAFT_173233 [Lottia gigantea]ESP00380.1 hypothetical protein LOTGIDRAFT_173233 [Lottia gigantea]